LPLSADASKIEKLILTPALAIKIIESHEIIDLDFLSFLRITPNISHAERKNGGIRD
jgi:hypothetical protein